MRAARYQGFREPIAIVDLPDPSPPPGGVVVQVAATGVCRSDWHAWQGNDDDVTPPHVPGHEFAGTVVARGRDVMRLTLGMRVVVPFILGCGACGSCRSGVAQICESQLQPGFHLPGSFAEFVAVPRADFNIVPLPDNVSFAAAAGLGCRYTTAWRGVVQRAGPTEGRRIAIYGCGGVGLAAIQIAVAGGAEVVASDPNAAALARAVALGATADDAGTATPVDVVVDAIGHPGVAAAGIGRLGPGGRYVQLGILEGDGTAPVSMNRVMRQEITILGSHGMAARGFPELVELVAAGHLDPEALVTHRVSLDEGIDHLAHLPDRAGRVVLIERMR